MRGQGGRTIKQLSIRSNETKLLLSTTTRRGGKGKNRTIPLFFPPLRRDKSTMRALSAILLYERERKDLLYHITSLQSFIVQTFIRALIAPFANPRLIEI